MTTRFPRILKYVVFALLLAFCGHGAMAQGDSLSLMPELHGTLRARFEYQPEPGNSRFQVRNARVSVSGNILRDLVYKAEADLCDEGKMKMLDAYVRYKPQRWSATIGQMRVPFTIDAHRAPHQQFFANRSFLAKQVGNVRDVGLAASFVVVPQVKWTLEGGIFNGSGLTNQKDYWTDSYNFSLKTYASPVDNFTMQISCQKTRPHHVGIMMWDFGAYFDNDLWHFEAEYLRKSYAHGTFKAVNAVDVFAVRNFPVSRDCFTGVSALARYDFMSDHSSGAPDGESGNLFVNDPQRHRITAGATLHFARKSVYADLRLNYEQYFYRDHALVGPSDHSKLVVEVMVRF